MKTNTDSLLLNPVYLQRLEGLVVLIGGVWAWFAFGGNGWLLLALLLTPDLSMLGYLVNIRLGAALYNLVHSYPLGAAIVAAGLLTQTPFWVLFGLLLLIHIGMDRTVGYGLKLPSGFKDTHLSFVSPKETVSQN